MTSTGCSELDEVRDVALTCKQHGEYQGKSWTVLGRTLTSNCPHCLGAREAEEQERQKREEQYAKERRLNYLIGQSGIPERFKGRSFDNYRAETDKQQRALAIARAYAERFEDRLKHGGGLVFCGLPGTGKTHLATAIGNHILREQGRAVLFATVMKALRSVKETWHKDSERKERDVLRILLEPDLLILDEVGVQFGSDTERMILFEIINSRYESMRPTILLSNLPEEELGAYIGVRTLDRMQEGGGAVVAFDWESYRARVHKDEELPGQEVKPVEWGKVPGERGVVV